MSRIDDLIKELCPNGVEFRPLGEVARIKNGKGYKEFDSGAYPVYGSGGVMTHIDTFAYDKPSVLIPRKGSLGNVFYVEEPFWNVDTIFYTKINRDAMEPKFLYHVLLTMRLGEMNQAGGVPSQTQAVLNKIRIPVPPMEVQKEIVKILDAMTELKAELEAELEARRNQYIYYRDQLLTFTPDSNTEVQWMTLGDLCLETWSGSTPRAGTPAYYQDGVIPWLRTQEVTWSDITQTEVKITERALQETAVKWIPADCVIVAISGASAGRAAVNKIPLTTNQHCLNMAIDSELANYRYVFQWIASQYKNLKARGQGARNDLNAGIVKSFEIPVPPLEEQERIVEILDKFDALVNDISIGLPAEIEARRKQYEYYRDKLLTFEEAA